MPRRTLIALFAMMAALSFSATAQPTGQTPAVFEGVGIEEHLGEAVPRDLIFRDAEGQAVTLGDYLDGERPVLLTLVYHNCPMLCNLVLDGLTETLSGMEWTPGQEFELLTVSFNAIETPELAKKQKGRYVAELDRPDAAAGWHFLTGDSTAIAALTQAVGFQYKWVEAQQEFAHATALIFLSPDGIVTRYLYGFQFPPRDVRTALVEASAGTIGTTLDRLILYCFQYDPNANSYVPYAANLMKLGGGLTVLALVVMLGIFWRRERRRQRTDFEMLTESGL